MNQVSTKDLKRALRERLGKSAFQPVPSRLLWFALHWLVVVGGTYAASFLMQRGWSLWSLLPLSLVIGLSFAGLAFVAHETLHGAVTRNQRLRYWVGYLSFFPFCVSPRLWTAWHNRTHHAQTNRGPQDPDAYPRLQEYEEKSGVRLSVLLGAPRSRKWRGLITVLGGFSIQSLMVLWKAQARGYLRPRQYRLALFESAVAWSCWAGLGFFLGAPLLLVAFVLPLLVGNAIVMSYIVTNHALNPLGTHQDPLENSLTVNVPAWYQIYSLNFGYHVEHHLFPAMSSRSAPQVQEGLRALAPERYQEMPLGQALELVWSTPRVYRKDWELFEPETSAVHLTLGARGSIESAENKSASGA
jgi:fatty acid desaturase